MKNKLILLTTMVLLSCQTSEVEKHRSIIQQMVNREFEFPQEMECVENNEFQNVIFGESLADFKLVSFTDGTCGACIDKLQSLEKIVTHLKETTGKDIQLYHFVLSLNREHFMREFYPKLIGIRLFFIADNEMLLRNNIPLDPLYQTFLLNKDNKIVLVGSPVNNEKMVKLYRKTLNES